MTRFTLARIEEYPTTDPDRCVELRIKTVEGNGLRRSRDGDGPRP